MKKKTSILFILYFIAGCVVSYLFHPAYRMLVNPATMLINYEKNLGLPTYITVALLALALIIPLFVFKKIKPCEGKGRGFYFFSCAFCVLAFLSFGIYATVRYIIDPYFLHSMLDTMRNLSMQRIIDIAYVASAVVSFISAFYFVILLTDSIRGKNTADNKAAGFFSCFPVLFFALRLIYFFMFTSAKAGMAGRKLIILAIVFCVLFFLTDAKRRYFDQGMGFSAYVSVSLAAFFSVLWFSLTYISLILAGWMTGYEGALLYILYLSVAPFVLSRVLSFEGK